MDIDLKGPMHGPTNPRERRTFKKHRANGSLSGPAIPSRVEKSCFEFPIREPSPADDRVPKILDRLANAIAFAIEPYLQRNVPDRNYGIRLDAPEQRPWAMRDFVLPYPSGGTSSSTGPCFMLRIQCSNRLHSTRAMLKVAIRLSRIPSELFSRGFKYRQ